MAQKGILTAKAAVRLGADDYVMVNCGGGLRRKKVRELEKLLRVPVPDVMYDFRGGDNSAADRETVKDLTGGGNDAVIVNCAFNTTGSGYAGGGLQLDGVDDFVKLTEGCKGFKTIFMECKPMSARDSILYDQRAGSRYYFAVYNEQANQSAYASRNTGGKVYINGQDNESAGWTGATLQYRRHLITITNDNATEANTKAPVIGGGNSSWPSEMTVYRFLGYKRVLTAEEIKAVIEVYGLLEECEGVNLLKGTATFDPEYIQHNYEGAWTKTGEQYNGLDIMRKTVGSTSTFVGFKFNLPPTQFPTIVSFYARIVENIGGTSGAIFGDYTYRNSSGITVSKTTNRNSPVSGGDWKRYYIYSPNGYFFYNYDSVFNAPTAGNGVVEFSNIIGTIEVCGFKVERVNTSTRTPTPWTPAIGEEFVSGGG